MEEEEEEEEENVWTICKYFGIGTSRELFVNALMNLWVT
jgi:hypothetical protein